LIAAAAAGTSKLRRKVVEAAFVKLHGAEAVDEALAAAADAWRRAGLRNANRELVATA